MNTKGLLCAALLAALPMAALADDASSQDGTWSGTGEAGLAMARGNAKSENFNAKLSFKKEDERWKDTIYFTGLRSKGEVKSYVPGVDANGQPVVNTLKTYSATANRYEVGGSVGYKFDERSYLVGALRYENDDFSPYEYQAVASIGYGYTVLKTVSDELSFEVGPGYKRYRKNDLIEYPNGSSTPVIRTFASEGEVIGRGLIAYKHNLTDTTAFVDTLLVEAGSDNTFVQNDAGLSVSINKAFALKLAYQVRHNTDALPGVKKTDQLITTNLVYNFGG